MPADRDSKIPADSPDVASERPDALHSRSYTGGVTEAPTAKPKRSSAPLGPIGSVRRSQGIVWVASYPKSGNTWVGTLLYSYAAGPPEQHGDETKLIARHAPVQAEMNKNAMTETDAYRRLRRAGNRVDKPAGWEDLTFVKTHSTSGDTRPLLRRTAGAIVIVRHPKDVLLSAINFLQMRGKLPGTPRDLAHEFISAGGSKLWSGAGYGTWQEQWRSWLRQARSPVLLVTYEGLKQDPAYELTRMVTFTGAPVDPARIAMAVDASDFSKMKARAAGPGAGGSQGFFNAGTSGRSLADVPEYGIGDLDEAFDARFNPQYEKFQQMAQRRYQPLL